MIEVTFKHDAEQRQLHLSAIGHAGYAPIGNDIVCAAASILATTVAQIVKAMEAHGDLEEEPTIKLVEGNAVVACKVKEKALFAEALHTYFVAQVGYRLLAHSYPEYVKLITIGEPFEA